MATQDGKSDWRGTYPPLREEALPLKDARHKKKEAVPRSGEPASAPAPRPKHGYFRYLHN